MTADAGDSLNLQDPKGRHPLPLQDGLSSDAEALCERAGAARGGDGACKGCVSHACYNGKHLTLSQAFLTETTDAPACIVPRMSFGGHIRAARLAAGIKSQRELAEMLGVTRGAVANWEANQNMPDASHLLRMSQMLGVSVEELTGGETSTANVLAELPQPPPDIAAPRRQTKTRTSEATVVSAPPIHPIVLPQDVPVYGTAVGGVDSEFSFNGTVIDYVRRPPGLAHVEGAFAIYVTGDSMEPRYEPGELVYVNPSRPAAPGDDVLIEMAAPESGEPAPCYIKRLVRRHASRVECRQFNPPRDLEYPTAAISQIHRIMRPTELFGF